MMKASTRCSSLIVLLSLACILMLLLKVPDVQCYPPAGLDNLPNTTATIELEITGMFTETITANGPSTIARGMPYDPGDGHIMINTEIVSMSLTATSMYIGPLTIVESPSKTSDGTIRQLNTGVDFPANSSFHVYIEIHTTLPSPVGILHTDDPVIMNAVIDNIPPWGAIYKSLAGPVALKSEQDSIIGFIRHVEHKVERLEGPTGGYAISVDNTRPDWLHSPYLYIGLISTILIASAATVTYIRHGKRKR